MFIKINIQGQLFKRSLIKPRFNKSLEMCSLVGYFKKINTFLVHSVCFHKTVRNKWCLDKTLGKIKRDLGLDQTSNFLLHGPKSVGSDVELGTRRTNQLNQTKKQF